MTTNNSAEDFDKTFKDNLTPEQYTAFKDKMMRSALITRFLFAYEPLSQKDALMKVLLQSSDLTVNRILSFTTDVMKVLTSCISSDDGSDSDVINSSDSSDSEDDAKNNS